jgi:hypothetical protein
MTKPYLTTYTDERLAEYHLFVLRMRRSNNVTPNGGMAYLREARRVERELARRMEIAR